MFKHRYFALAMFFALFGCGGGGGDSGDSGDGGTQSTPNESSLTLSNVLSESTFSWAAKTDLTPNEYTVPVRYLYPADLTGDGIDEIIFAGWETQPNDAASFTNSKVTIYGWENGVFKDLTTRLIPGGSGVEGVGRVVIGDFDKNGHVDFVATGNADMDYNLHTFAFMNSGTTFTKVDLGISNGVHGGVAADINKDGYIDYLPVGYFFPTYYYLGSANGLARVDKPEMWLPTNGSGGAVADFMGNGTVSLIVSDNGVSTQGTSDTILYQAATQPDNTVSFSKVAVLPPPRFENPVFGLSGRAEGDSHDVRVEAFDFNNDNLMDALVFSRPWQQPGSTEWPNKSQIQFLQNTGNGNFIDVTETFLVGYDINSSPTYAVVFRDLNNDGLVDIFTSESSPNSTAILLKQLNGTYVETGRSTFSTVVHQPDGFGVSTVARGPNGKNYLVYNRNDYGTGVGHVMLRELTVR